MGRHELSPDDIYFIRNTLRRETIKWPGRKECLRRAKKRVLERRDKNGKAVYKNHWQCAGCKRWVRDEKELEMDHIIEVGPFNGDWNEYLLRLFPSQDNLQMLCIPCHMKKTKAYNSARSRWERKK